MRSADNLFKLQKETFEEGSPYLDDGAGLFQTLDAITGEVASRPVPRSGRFRPLLSRTAFANELSVPSPRNGLRSP